MNFTSLARKLFGERVADMSLFFGHEVQRAKLQKCQWALGSGEVMEVVKGNGFLKCEFSSVSCVLPNGRHPFISLYDTIGDYLTQWNIN